MSDTLLDDYKAYYAARAEKYAGNPNYACSYEAEKRLSEAMQSCAVLEEFRDKIGDLNERCAVALTRDQNLMQKKHFDKHKETIRVKACDRILEKVDACKVVNDVITLVNEEMNKNMIEISMDEAQRQFIFDWEYIDMAEVYSHAVVPDPYKKEMQDWAAELRKNIAEGIRRAAASHQEWQQGWKMNPDVIMEYRHRRLLPFTDEQILEQIEKYKKIIYT
jgi:hypothetical protein